MAETKNECPPLFVNGVHITDVKLCHVHAEVLGLRNDLELEVNKLNERLKALEDKINLCRNA
jgi:hypothetical protein